MSDSKHETHDLSQLTLFCAFIFNRPKVAVVDFVGSANSV